MHNCSSNQRILANFQYCNIYYLCTLVLFISLSAGNTKKKY